MAIIKASYDLSGGTTRSSVITGGTYLDVQAFLTTVSGRVSYFFEKRNSDTGDWVPMRENGKKIVFHTNGTTENAESVSLVGSDTEYSVNIVPGASTTGTLVLDANTDGTIA
jgi:hypothetical protein